MEYLCTEVKNPGGLEPQRSLMILLRLRHDILRKVIWVEFYCKHALLWQVLGVAGWGPPVDCEKQFCHGCGPWEFPGKKKSLLALFWEPLACSLGPGSDKRQLYSQARQPYRHKYDVSYPVHEKGFLHYEQIDFYLLRCWVFLTTFKSAVFLLRPANFMSDGHASH